MPNPKIGVLVGSLRRDSFHRLIADSLPALAPPGAEIVALPSVDLPLYDGDVEAAGIPEIVRQLGDAITAVDSVVILSPEYNYSIAGVLKNAIDWLSRLKPQPLAGKPMSIISASPGLYGGARGQYHLRQVLVALDAKVLNKPEVMVGSVMSKVDPESRTITDERTRAGIQRQLAALVEFTGAS